MSKYEKSAHYLLFLNCKPKFFIFITTTGCYVDTETFIILKKRGVKKPQKHKPTKPNLFSTYSSYQALLKKTPSYTSVNRNFQASKLLNLQPRILVYRESNYKKYIRVQCSGYYGQFNFTLCLLALIFPISLPFPIIVLFDSKKNCSLGKIHILIQNT